MLTFYGYIRHMHQAVLKMQKSINPHLLCSVVVAFLPGTRRGAISSLLNSLWDTMQQPSDVLSHRQNMCCLAMLPAFNGSGTSQKRRAVMPQMCTLNHHRRHGL